MNKIYCLLIFHILTLLFLIPQNGYTQNPKNLLDTAEKYYYNGQFDEALRFSKEATKLLKATSVTKVDRQELVRILNQEALAQTAKFDFKSADKTYLEVIAGIPSPSTNLEKELLAKTFFDYSLLKNLQNQTDEAIELTKKANLLASDSPRLKANYYLNLGKIFYQKKLFISAINCLENIEELLGKNDQSFISIEANRYLYLSWFNIGDLKHAGEAVKKMYFLSQKTKYLDKQRQSIDIIATYHSFISQEPQAIEYLKKGFTLATTQNGQYHQILFSIRLAQHLIYKHDFAEAIRYFKPIENLQVEKLNLDSETIFEYWLVKTILQNTKNPKRILEQLNSLEIENHAPYTKLKILGWKYFIFNWTKDYQKALDMSNEYLSNMKELNLTDNETLYYLFSQAKLYSKLGNTQAAKDVLDKTINLVEERRKSDDYQISLGVLEILNEAYRLKTELVLSDSIDEALRLSDLLKARVLQDKINEAPIRSFVYIDDDTKNNVTKAIEAYLQKPDKDTEAKLIEFEKLSSTKRIQPTKDNFNFIETARNLNVADFGNNTVVVSYLFVSEKLIAFVKEPQQSWRTVEIAITKPEIERLAKETEQKIINDNYYKKDAENFYKLLLEPLKLNTPEQIIIIPDGALWKLPFQTFATNNKFLIELMKISYAPCISILSQQLKVQSIHRRKLLAFANSNFHNKDLKYVNDEALSVSKIYNTKPYLETRIIDFKRVSNTADILHFSMHAEIDELQPFNSFLAFKPHVESDGKFTVSDLLEIKLKKGSLVFFASCNTNSIYLSEGLVSLAWGAMGAGATSVITSQWEVDDKSSQLLTTEFYRNYFQGDSSATALQKASIKLINEKGDHSKPYYWAAFQLIGDYR